MDLLYKIFFVILNVSVAFDSVRIYERKPLVEKGTNFMIDKNFYLLTSCYFLRF